VPFIVHWKGRVEPAVNDGIVTALDLLPSLATIAGGAIPPDRMIDGMDLSDVLLGKTTTSKRDTFFYYLCNSLEAARVGDWKLHVAKPRVSRSAEEEEKGNSEIPAPNIDDDVEVRELYNLREDPGETKNVYGAHPDVVSMIHEKIRSCREDIGDAFTKVAGKNVRPIGKVSKAKPLTQYDENHPYIVAMYDKNEVG
jgi:arylsulfatase A-like enzyme